MAPLKEKGDVAELAVALDLRRRGYQVAFPFGEDWGVDLILARTERLERVQVKYTRSDGRVVVVRARSQSLTNGRVRAITKYTADTIDWLAVYDATTDRCYYIPAAELGEGRAMLHLRLVPALSGRRRGIRWAADYTDLSDARRSTLLRKGP